MSTVHERAFTLAQELVRTATNVEFEDLRTEMTTSQVMREFLAINQDVSEHDRLLIAVGVINNLLAAMQVFADEIAGVR